MRYISPKDLQRRLKNAYEAGKFDGFHQGADETHEIWVSVLDKVKGYGKGVGIGKKRKAAIMELMKMEVIYRLESKENRDKNKELRDDDETGD